MARLVFLAALVFGAVHGAQAAEEDDDKMCEVIGEAPNLSVPPKDRLWFKENCVCAGAVGCGKSGSSRFGQRLDTMVKARAASEAARKKKAKEAADRAKRYAAKTARLRAAILPSFGAGQSSAERLAICNRLAEGKVADPGTFCQLFESDFIETPEGRALWRAEIEGEAAAAAESSRAEQAAKDAEEEAQMSKRVRACCEGIRECVRTNGSAFCNADRALLRTACRSARPGWDPEIARMCNDAAVCERAAKP